MRTQLVCWSLLGLVIFGGASHAGVLPEEITSRLAWLSQEELSQRGETAIADLPQGDRLAAESMLRGAAMEPAEDPTACDVVAKSPSTAQPVDLQKALRKAKYALLGHVVSSEQGLAHGSPATLYEVSVDQILTWPSGASTPKTVYLLRYEGSVTVAGSVLCSQGERFPEVPRVGRGVLVLAENLILSEPTLIHALERDFFFETGGGYTSEPGDQHTLDRTPWEQFIAELVGRATQ